jgi:F0F1-type ATP synthase assembly protein I
MPWLGITAVVLFVAGLLAPVLGLILDRDFGHAPLALCIAGMAGLGAALILRRLRGDRDTSGSVDGGVSDATTDFGRHNGHDGGHGGDDGDGGH